MLYNASCTRNVTLIQENEGEVSESDEAIECVMLALLWLQHHHGEVP